MNGLKAINDNEGHAAGDEALSTLASCFKKATKSKYFVYRVGGDEFVIIGVRSNEKEIKELIERIEKNVSETRYHCAIGYSYKAGGDGDIDEMLKESDEMMYANKAKYYSEQKSGSIS
jgi:diguanylate cyclase (GGDEF)-like protein